MSFNQFVTIPQEVRKKLPFIGASYYYLYKNSGGNILRGYLYEISTESMEKAWKRLSGADGEIVSGDKVFVLPNCRIPMFKLSDYLKEVGARQEVDIAHANKIIGHLRCKETVSRQAQMSSMLLEMGSTHLASRYKNPYWGQQKQWDKLRDEFNQLIDNPVDSFEDIGEIPVDTIVSSAVFVEGSCFTSYEKRFMTPACAWILYHHILKKIPVISEECIYHKIGKPIVIDSDSYLSIRDMLASHDEDSQRTGAEILANCDIEPSLFYIWKLANQYYSKVRNFNSFKNVRLFMRMSKWDKISGMNNEDFIEYLYSRRQLTKEYFSELVNTAALSYSHALQSNVFAIKVVPSEKYKEFSSGQKFKFSNDHPEVNNEVEVEEETDE